VKIPKPTDEDKAYFQSLVADLPGVTVKPMFGNLGGFVNGNMFAGLFGDSVGLRLDDAGRDELLAKPGAGPFGPEERPMGGYVALPTVWRGKPKLSQPWVERALAHTSALPPKKPKKK
jgi:TfoX/Sxy family transcriptional regulator of competence genes